MGLAMVSLVQVINQVPASRMITCRIPPSAPQGGNTHFYYTEVLRDIACCFNIFSPCSGRREKNMKTDIKIDWLKAQLIGIQHEIDVILEEIKKGGG